MISRAIPYEGTEPYIFLSYCHKDADQVYPLLEQMVCDGYRIWYDDGNHPGDDWLENIAKHLAGCTICLAMISEQSSRSHNCKSEISEAIAWKKKLAAVMLENFKMPLGMQLQLSTIHYVKKTEYPASNLLLQKLYDTEGLQTCRTTPGSLPMRESVLEEANPVPKKSSKDDAIANFVITVGTKAIVEPIPSKLKPEAVSAATPIQKVHTADKNTASSTSTTIPTAPKISSSVQTPPSSMPDEDDVATIFDESDELPASADDGETPTVMAYQEQEAILVRTATGKAYPLTSDLSRIGRSAKRCEIVITDNSFIGNCHAEIARFEGKYVLRDLDSANGTFVDGTRLTREDKIPLRNGSMFLLHNDAFVLFTGSFAKQIASDGGIFYLHNAKNHGIKLVLESPLLLDRGHKWPDGTLDDPKISRSGKHAKIIIGENGLCLEDKGSTNGTRLNGRNIRGLPPQLITAGDQIKIGDTILQVGIITL